MGSEGEKGAQLVNAPGTWNWSDLNTRDLEGAKVFYAAVFGWEADTLDFGGFEATMLRVPGYGITSRRATPICAAVRQKQATPRASRTRSAGWCR